MAMAVVRSVSGGVGDSQNDNGSGGVSLNWMKNQNEKNDDKSEQREREDNRVGERVKASDNKLSRQKCY